MYVADPSRRRAILSAAAAAAALLLPARARAPSTRASSGAGLHGGSTHLRIGVALSAAASADELRRGAELGVEEAARTAQLLGTRVELVRLPDPLGEKSDLDNALAAPDRPQVVLGGTDTDTALALSRAAERRGILFLNLGADAESLRQEHCRRSTFHVAPSERMKHDALRLTGLANDHRAEAWHPSLERFGAGQLAARHEARFGTGMSASAWCGWAAAKISAEASLRARSVEPAVLITYLESPRARFDVHKGLPVGFRPWDHQLRQPLYVIAPAASPAGTVVAEIPQPRDAGALTWNELLDKLGTPESATSCSWSS